MVNDFSENRHDIKHWVLDALVIFFDQHYHDNRAEILQTHKFDKLRSLTDEIRSKICPDPTNWRDRQCMALFIEGVFVKVAQSCPVAVLFELFGDDMIKMCDESK
jgi:hypothetical protein